MLNDKKAHDESKQASAFSAFWGAGPRVELKGSKEALIEGATGVIYYSDSGMRIGLGQQTLLVTGSELVIRTMFGSTLVVSGHISTIEFI